MGPSRLASIRYPAYVAAPQPSEEPVSELVRGITEEVRQLVADEVALAKAEVGETLRRGLKALIGAVTALVGGAIMLGFALVTLVVWIPNHTLVAGLVAAVGLLLVLAGGGLIVVNRHLMPFTVTRKTLQEDLEWARRQSRRAHR